MSLLFALSAASVLMIAGAIFEHALTDRLLKRDVEELSGKMELARDIILSARKFEDVSNLPIRLNDVVFGHPGIVISVRSENGAAIFSAGNQQVARQLQGEAALPGAQPLTKQFGDKFYRFMSAQVMRGA